MQSVKIKIQIPVASENNNEMKYDLRQSIKLTRKILPPKAFE